MTIELTDQERRSVCWYCHGVRLVGWSGAGPILCPECSRGEDAFTVITQAWREQRTKVKALESELTQLRRGIVANAGRLSNRRLPRWAHVRDAVGVGSTSARELCRDSGLDPEELVGNP